MSLAGLTNNVKLLGTMGFVVGIVLIILSKFTAVSGITDTANTSVNDFITGIAEVSGWIGIIILAIIGIYIMKLWSKST